MIHTVTYLNGWERAAMWERNGNAFPRLTLKGGPNPVANCGFDTMFYKARKNTETL